MKSLVSFACRASRCARLVFAAVCLVGTLPIDNHAEQMPLFQAENVCRNWLSVITSRHGDWGGEISPDVGTSAGLEADGVPLGTYFEIEPSGWVVVPSLAELPAVTAYSEKGRLDLEADGGMVQLIRDLLERRVNRFIESYGSLDVPADLSDQVFTSDNRALWNKFALTPSEFRSRTFSALDISGAEAGPLLTSAWHQGDPYNQLCPEGDLECIDCNTDTPEVDPPGSPTYVGCVATATAQIMNYHRWPARGNGSVSYSWMGDGSCGGSSTSQAFLVDLTNPYDWPNMLDSYDGTETQAQRDAVAELCYEVGICFHMDYGVCGSGATTSDALTILPNQFRYSSAINRLDRGDYTEEEWYHFIAVEVDADRPMLYRILGHAIVCDGYQTSGELLQYHVNYGWGDSNPGDGWFTIDELPGSEDPDINEYIIREIRAPMVIAVPSDYSTIQAAINNASPLDTILVGPGTYFEALSVAEAVVILSSGGYASTTINGSGAGACVTFASSADSLTKLSGFTLTNAGAGVECSGSQALIENCRFDQFSGFKVSNAHPQMVGYYAGHGNTFSLNYTGTHNALHVRTGTISDSTVWPAMSYGMVYYVDPGAYVNYCVSVQGPNQPELRIEPGAIVKLPAPVHKDSYPQGDYGRFLGIGVSEPGILTACGVHFTALTDDFQGGNSNGGDFAQPSAPYWSSVYLGSNAGASSIDSCFIKYGGNPNYNSVDAAFYVAGSDPDISRCEFEDNNTAVRVDGGMPVVEDNQITGCTDYAVWLDIPEIVHFVSGNTIFEGSYFLARLDPMAVEYFVSNNTLSGNVTDAYNAIHVELGTISANTVWPLLPPGMTYYLDPGGYYSYSISVEGAGSPELLIESGNVVKLPAPVHKDSYPQGDYARNLNIGVGNPGRLTAHNVYFTALTDDDWGGNSNGGAYGTPTSPYWSAIVFGANSGGSSLVGCHLRHGGNPDFNSTDAAVYITGNNVVVANSTIDACNTAVRVDGGFPFVENNIITGSFDYGVWLDMAVVNHMVRNNTIRDGAYFQARLDPMAVEQFVRNNTLELNVSDAYNALLIEYGTITASTVWPSLPAGMSYYVIPDGYTSYSVSVQAAGGPSLTIEPGCVVKLPPPVHKDSYPQGDYARTFNIGVGDPGRLIARGVYFTALTDDDRGGNSNGGDYSHPTSPYWSSIYLGDNSSGSVMEDCFVSYGGNPSYNSIDAAVYVTNSNPNIAGCAFDSNYTAVRVDGGFPTIEENNIRGSSNYGLWMDIPIVGHLVRNNTISEGAYFQARLDPLAVEQFVLNNTLELNPGGGYDALHVELGTIANSTIWPRLPEGMSYYLDPSGYYSYCVCVEGPSSPELTIEPGSVVKLPAPVHKSSYPQDDYARYFRVGVSEPGRLTARGVTFTALTDDYLGGNSTGGSVDRPSLPYWCSIYFGANSGGSSIDSCEVRFGGNTSYNSIDAALYITGSSPQITRSVLEANGVAVRLLNAQQPLIENNMFLNNSKGVQSAGSDPVVQYNWFDGNAVCALQNTTSTEPYLDARYNGWGDNTGPNDPSAIEPDFNPDGLGDSISDYVIYRPWQDAPEVWAQNAGTGSQLVVRWTSSDEDNTDYYQVHVGLEPGSYIFGSVPVYEDGSSVYLLTVNGLEENLWYYAAVRAYNGTAGTWGPYREIAEPVRLTKPVVLVHGWNSGSPGTWDQPVTEDDFKGWLEAEGFDHVWVASIESCGGAGEVLYDANAQTLADFILAQAASLQSQTGVPLTSVNFVAHSMGGLVSRRLIATPEEFGFSGWRVDNLIMLGTPNGGSPVAALACTDWPGNFNPYDLICAGPAMCELSPARVSQFNHLYSERGGTVFSAVAGSACCNAFRCSALACFAQEEYEHDGTVSVASVFTIPLDNQYIVSLTHGELPRTRSEVADAIVIPILEGNPPVSSSWDMNARGAARTASIASSEGLSEQIVHGSWVKADSLDWTYDTVALEPCDNALFWLLPRSSGADIKLIAPSGATIDSAAAANDSLRLSYYHELGLAALAVDAPASGEWVIGVRAEHMLDSVAPVLCLVSVINDIHLTFETEDTVVTTWTPVKLYATLDSNTGPICGAGVEVAVRHGTSDDATIVLLDDGVDVDMAADDGTYSGVLNSTGLEGVYTFKCTANAENGSGTPVVRYGLTQALVISEDCCMPPTIGDVNQSGTVDIVDIQVMIDHQYLSLTDCVCDTECDLDFSGAVDITDLQILIDYQYISLTELPPCP